MRPEKSTHRALHALNLQSLTVKQCARMLHITEETARGALSSLRRSGMADSRKLWSVFANQRIDYFTITPKGIHHCQELLA